MPKPSFCGIRVMRQTAANVGQERNVAEVGIEDTGTEWHGPETGLK
jgi:hypothetical protein